LAAGEQFAIDGGRFLRAVALGYDVGPRVTTTLGGLPWQMESHRSAHSIAGTFGAAAAAGSAAGLSAQQMRWLLDYAGQQASGIAAWQRDTEHIEKSLVFAGMPARNGVSAALLIQLGGTGVDDIFSGADNFLLSFAPQADPARLIDKLGERYEVTRTNIKKWTVGSPIQAPLDALENLRKRHPFDAAGVQRVEVRLATSEAKTVNDREMPDISLQYMVAVMLLDKTASFAAAHDKPRMQDAAVQREKAKVQLIPDEELERLYPRRETVVEVTLTEGTRLTERVSAVRGTAENPMTRDEVVAKCRDLMAPVVGASGAGKLIARVLELERTNDIRELRPLLQA
jgi:2-methylcitrate dehydratase PrpD